MKNDRRTFRIHDSYFVLRNLSYLAHRGDWHNALVPTVNRAVSRLGTVRRPLSVPEYPLRYGVEQHDLLYEVGSYWEAAIYLIKGKIGARHMLTHLKLLESSPDRASFQDSLLLAVWNSHGQLKWLKAHLIREEYLAFTDVPQESHEHIRRYSTEIKNADLQWLANFVEQHHEEGLRYPNPYFGGTNPLHLGLVSTDP